MNTTSKDSNRAPKGPNDYAAYLAIDWADQEHTYSLQEVGKTTRETGTLEQKPETLGPWVLKLSQRFGGRPIAVAMEQSRGALIHFLLSYDFLVLYPVHPCTVAKFRQAFRVSGTKSDPVDANTILEILTKHLEQLKPLSPDTTETRLLGRLCEDRRKVVDLRTRHIEGQIACLKEYFPQALQALHDNLASRLACDFIRKWPTLEAFQHAKPSTLKHFYYGHNIRSAALIQQVLDLAKMAQSLTRDPALIESGRRLAQMHAQQIRSLNQVIADYDQRIKEVFCAHPEAELFSQVPGAGSAMAPRLLAFFGTDRSRYANATNAQSASGIAPVTRSSGKSELIRMRRACPKFLRQTFHEFARLSVAQCQWARNYVDYYTARGKKYNTVIRALAFKWIRILFRCWQNHTRYNDDKYMATLKQRGSIFATLHLKTATQKNL